MNTPASFWCAISHFPNAAFAAWPGGVVSEIARAVSAPHPSASLPFRFRTCRYRETLDRRLDQSGAGPPVRIEGKHGEPVGGVNVRAGEDHGRLLVNLLNLARPPQFVQPVTKPAVKHAFNLVDGK